MNAIEFRKVDPYVDAACVPAGWIAYRSTKTVAAMLAESVAELMHAEGLSKSAAEAEFLRRGLAKLDRHQPLVELPG